MSWPLLAWSGPLLSFDSAGQGVGALLENRSARLVEIGLPLPQASFNPRGIRKVAAAKPEGVGRTRGPLLGRSPILLREGDRLTKRSRHPDNKSHFVFRNHLASLFKLMFSLHSANRIPAKRKEPFRNLPCGTNLGPVLTDPPLLTLEIRRQRACSCHRTSGSASVRAPQS